MSIALGDFVTLRLIRGCALGPLEASALGGKTSSPYGKVRWGKPTAWVDLGHQKAEYLQTGNSSRPQHSFSVWQRPYRSTSSKDGTFYLVYACVFVHQQLHVKATDWIFTKLSPETYVCTRKTSGNFGSQPDLDRDVGIGRNLYHGEIGQNLSASIFTYLPSLLRHCWSGDRKGIRPVKSWVFICWWRRFDWSFARFIAPAVTITLASTKPRMRTLWYRLT